MADPLASLLAHILMVDQTCLTVPAKGEASGAFRARLVRRINDN